MPWILSPSSTIWPIDSRGELPDGTVFNGPEELKRLLLARKDQFVRHLTAKLLGYALGRGLTGEDYCTVDEIADQLRRDHYSAQTLVLGIVRSVPFRYKQGTDLSASVQFPPSASQENCP